MSYFENFGKVLYDLGLPNEKYSPIILLDLIKRVNFSIVTEYERSFLLNDYQIQDGETPEIISYKLYGTTDYHWTVLYVNDRFDYVDDFPMDDSQLQEFVYRKYGSTTAIHHYEDNRGNVIGWNRSVETVPLTATPLGENETVNSGTIIGPDESVIVSGPELSDDDVLPEEETIPTYYDYFDINMGFYDPEGNAINNQAPKLKQGLPVTVLEHETKLNDQKRIIKVVNPNWIGKFSDDYIKALTNA